MPQCPFQRTRTYTEQKPDLKTVNAKPNPQDQLLQATLRTQLANMVWTISDTVQRAENLRTGWRNSRTCCAGLADAMWITCGHGVRISRTWCGPLAVAVCLRARCGKMRGHVAEKARTRCGESADKLRKKARTRCGKSTDNRADKLGKKRGRLADKVMTKAAKTRWIQGESLDASGFCIQTAN